MKIIVIQGEQHEWLSGPISIYNSPYVRRNKKGIIKSTKEEVVEVSRGVATRVINITIGIVNYYSCY